MYNMHAAGHPANGRGTKLLEDYKMKRGLVFGGIIVAAMLAFEFFNYTTTDYALTNLLGDLRFMGIRWATILAIAFCGMDFAGIARLFTPARGRGENVEVWYLLAAWFLAATMNAMLTWWGVSLALLGHEGLGNEILDRETLLAAVPVFVAILVWLIRILLIGMMSMAGDRLFSQVEEAIHEADAAAAMSRQRPTPGPARLPTADFAEHSPAPRSAHTAPRVIGNNSASDSGRPMTVAEKHGYGRMAQGTRPVAPPPPPANAVRPVPKPTNGNGHSQGNGNGHARPVAARPTNGHPLDDDDFGA